MIYWHVEKKSLCVYSQLKSCSASEVAARIQGVLRHCTSIEIDRNYVDTHGPPGSFQRKNNDLGRVTFGDLR
jgi:TnpA family transposase